MNKKKDNTEAELQEYISGFYNNPFGYVRAVFPWGVRGTQLEDHSGPDKWQRKILTYIGEKSLCVSEAVQVAVASGHGVGKAQPVDIVVDTPNGKRKFGGLKVGDYVFGGDGNPTKIIAIHPQGIKSIYQVEFDDKTKTEVCKEHLWKVSGRTNRRKDRSNKHSEWNIFSTNELLNKGVMRKNGSSKTRQWKIPAQGAVEYSHQWIPIDPYTLGAWLGDGATKSGRITNCDNEVIEHIKETNDISKGYKHNADDKASCWTIYGLKAKLKKLGIAGCHSYDKYIPIDYLENEVEIRKELLRGLLDTDGCVGKQGAVQYSSVSEQLIKDITWLARSLGGKVSYYISRYTYYTDKNGNKKRGRLSYRITIRMPDGFQYFYINRKQERVRDKIQKRYLNKWIDSIEHIGEKECMCITVEAKDGLYLSNDFIVTHNSALIAWIIKWFMSTRTNPQIVVTANTKEQLTSKTWRELSKWQGMSLDEHWFTWAATKFSLKESDTWFAKSIPWSKQNTEAFAGTHAENVMLLFDEASAIPDEIWEVASGAMTTVGAMWICFGNPTRNTGRFKECWGEFSHRWYTMQVDSRDAKMTNKKELQNWIDDYGEDSDFVRIRVKGVFPRTSASQFIGEDLVQEAIDRELTVHAYDWAPIIIGVDVARYGDDRSSICVRQGLYIHEIRVFMQLDTQELAIKVAKAEDDYQAEYVMIDAIGIGAGVVDRLIHVGRTPLEVVAGQKASDPKYYNKRAEMWGLTRDWLIKGASIPDRKDLKKELASPLYGFTPKLKIQIESKKDLKIRLPLMGSPDVAESLIHTFAFPVAGDRFDKDDDDYDYSDSYRNRNLGRSTVTGY